MSPRAAPFPAPVQRPAVGPASARVMQAGKDRAKAAGGLSVWFSGLDRVPVYSLHTERALGAHRIAAVRPIFMRPDQSVENSMLPGEALPRDFSRATRPADAVLGSGRLRGPRMQARRPLIISAVRSRPALADLLWSWGRIFAIQDPAGEDHRKIMHGDEQPGDLGPRSSGEYQLGECTRQPIGLRAPGHARIHDFGAWP
jgi:hypothetical protein